MLLFVQIVVGCTFVVYETLSVAAGIARDSRAVAEELGRKRKGPHWGRRGVLEPIVFKCGPFFRFEPKTRLGGLGLLEIGRAHV